jgi:hypothetical protein
MPCKFNGIRQSAFGNQLQKQIVLVVIFKNHLPKADCQKPTAKSVKPFISPIHPLIKIIFKGL